MKVPKEEHIQVDGINLSPTDRKIIGCLLMGYDNQEIATELHLSRRTIKEHLTNLFVLFRINTGVKRVNLAVYFYRRQLWKELGVNYQIKKLESSCM